MNSVLNLIPLLCVGIADVEAAISAAGKTVNVTVLEGQQDTANAKGSDERTHFIVRIVYQNLMAVGLNDEFV